MLAWLGRPGWAADTRRSHRAAAVGFFAWCALNGVLAADPCLRLPGFARQEHLPRPAPDAVVRRAVAECRDPRVRLMIEIAAGEGLRRAEIACLHTSQVTRINGGWNLLVHGKGARDRALPLWPELAEAILAAGPGYLFPGGDGGHLSADWVGRLIHEALGGEWGPHSLRHSFACRLYEQTGDIFLVQKFLGHAKIETTLVYTRMPNVRMREGLAALGGILPPRA